MNVDRYVTRARAIEKRKAKDVEKREVKFIGPNLPKPPALPPKEVEPFLEEFIQQWPGIPDIKDFKSANERAQMHNVAPWAWEMMRWVMTTWSWAERGG
jgi:hypothetical protein